ncbi:unnamed protein product [Rhizophagus irregularis]|uniref:Uncharacterized protein n=1 Tax=Rhizophagus irregularis TaxID=588596 RepID=A0A916E7J8_9GLOM|nr:unnamed protein product [Rhizophagus irregularis]
MGPFASELHVKPCSQQPVPQGGHMQVAGAAASCLLVNAPIMILGLGLAERCLNVFYRIIIFNILWELMRISEFIACVFISEYIITCFVK